MAQQPGGTARVAQGKSSVRAQSKPDPFATKPVFRPILDNPLNLAWPTLSAPVRKLILDALLEFLATTPEGELSIADWRLQDHARRRGRVHGAGKGSTAEGLGNKKRTRDGKSKGKGKPPGDTMMDTAPVASTSSISVTTHEVSLRSTKSYSIPNSVDHPPSTKTTPAPFPRPRLLDYVSIGINEVTRAMESRIRWGRWELGDVKAVAVAPRVVASQDEQVVVAGEQKKKATRRGGKKSTNSKSSPRSTIDPAAPSYEFLSTNATRDIAIPYLLPPSASTPFFRLLANFQRQPPSPPKPIQSPFDIATSLQQGAPTELNETAATKVDWVPFLDIIFVCKPDINPPSLVAHLPTMTAAMNGVLSALKSKREVARESAQDGDVAMGQDERRVERDVLLVPLDLGAERQLAAVLALRRVAAIGISTEAPGVEALLALVQKHVKPLSAPWLIPHLTQIPVSTPAPTSSLIPTHVKHLRTTAPVDVKGLAIAKKDKKLKRAQGREVYVAED